MAGLICLLSIFGNTLESKVASRTSYSIVSKLRVNDWPDLNEICHTDSLKRNRIYTGTTLYHAFIRFLISLIFLYSQDGEPVWTSVYSMCATGDHGSSGCCVLRSWKAWDCQADLGRGASHWWVSFVYTNEWFVFLTFKLSFT